MGSSLADPGQGDDDPGRACGEQGEDDPAAQGQEQDQRAAEDGVLPRMGQGPGQRLIGCGFAALASYLLVQSTVALAAGYDPWPSLPGMAWTAVTAAEVFTLAAGKARTGRALGNAVLLTEGRVTAIDGLLAVAVLLGLVLNAVAEWWWADPAAGYLLVCYPAREVWSVVTGPQAAG
jgi:hypothetical protein